MADIKAKWKMMPSEAQAPFKDQAKKLTVVYKVTPKKWSARGGNRGGIVLIVFMCSTSVMVN